ncbi:hypothetical protein CDEF62S_05444 [Castellaniella defragrans]
MIKITDDMKDLVERTMLCFAATVSEDNTPNLSPKGSLRVIDGKLYFANIASPQTIKNLKRNPAIEINVIDSFSRRGYRFKGKATILRPEDAEARPLVNWVLTSHGPTVPVYDVIRVDIDRAKQILSPAYTCSDPVPAEEDVRKAYYKKYGVQPL